MATGFDRLTDVLDGQEPTGFEQVADEDMAMLADAVQRTLREHASELERATLESLRFVPRPLRRPVRAILGL